MQKRKILQLYYEPHLSGISRHVIYLLNALKDEPYGFWVLCSTGDGKIQQSLKKTLGENYVRIVPPGRFFSWRGFFKALRIIRSEKIDTVHVHNLQSAAWGYAAVILSGCRRVIFTPHVFGTEIRFFKIFSRHLWKILRPFTMMYIAVSKTQHDHMRSRGFIIGPDRVKFVANHVDELHLRNRCREDRETIRKENGISETAVVVSQMARLDRQKNPFFLIKVTQLLQEQAPDMVFMLIGEGPLKIRLKREIERHNLNGRVRLMGYRHDGLDLLRASDIVTLTSRWEGLPYALLEANCFKKPVVATDIPGNRDLVADGESGFLANTPEEFAGKLFKLAQSRELREQFGKEGYNRNKDLFNPDRMALQMRKIYD